MTLQSTAIGRLARRSVAVYIPLVFILCTMLFPFYWMFITSFKSLPELYDVDVSPFLVHAPTLQNYVGLLTQTPYLVWLQNTMIVTVGSTLIAIVASIPAGYALARLNFRGAALLGWLIFVTYLVPPTLLFIPMMQLINSLGIANTHWALILTYPTFLIPFGTWLLTGYFRAIPRDMEECALVDGCTRLGAMVRIAIPLALPGVLSVFIFAFTLSWNEFIYALTLISDSARKTLPVAVQAELIMGDAHMWGQLMAAALLGSLPVAFIYSFFVEYFVAGMTAGAVKG